VIYKFVFGCDSKYMKVVYAAMLRPTGRQMDTLQSVFNFALAWKQVQILSKREYLAFCLRNSSYKLYL